MLRLTILTSVVFILGSLPGISQEPEKTLPSNATTSEASPTLAEALGIPGVPFRLHVDCGNENGFRQLEVFQSGIAIFMGRTQVSLGETQRSALLGILNEQGFANFDSVYGGEEKNTRERGPTIVTCRVILHLEGLEKNSVQLAEGRQSARLADLANALMNAVEPSAAEGITPTNLEDGLSKLASGQLAPETLNLRFVQLPLKDQTGLGSILIIKDGLVSHQEYSPGRSKGAPVSAPLSAHSAVALAKALQKGKPSTLPVNLWAESHIEFQLTVLGHGAAVVARPFSRLEAQKPSVNQRHFDDLCTEMRRFKDTLFRDHQFRPIPETLRPIRPTDLDQYIGSGLS